MRVEMQRSTRRGELPRKTKAWRFYKLWLMCDKIRESTLLSDDIIPFLSLSLCMPLSHSTDSIISRNTSSKLQASPSFSIRDSYDCSIKVLNGNSFIQSLLHGCQAPQRGKSWHLKQKKHLVFGSIWSLDLSEWFSGESLKTDSQSDVKNYTQARFITPTTHYALI